MYLFFIKKNKSIAISVVLKKLFVSFFERNYDLEIDI